MALPAIIGALAGSGGGAAAGGTAASMATATASAMGFVGSIQAVKGTLQNAVPSITTSTSKFTRAITYIPETILGVAHQIQAAAAAWGAAIFSPIDTLRAAGNQLSRGVARVNPATVQQFNIALEDAEGVIGRQMLPVLVRFTRATRDFADYLVKIEPITTRLASASIKLIDMGERLGKVIGDDLIPIMDYVTRLVQIQVTWWGKLAKALEFAAKWSILGQIVKIRGDDKPGGSSVGASIRNVRYMGSEEIHQETSRQSLIASMAGGANKQDMAWDATIMMPDWLRKIYELLRDRQEAAAKEILANRPNPLENIEQKSFLDLIAGMQAWAMAQSAANH